MFYQGRKLFTAITVLLVLGLTACGAPKIEVAKLKLTDDPSVHLAGLTSAVFNGRQRQLNVLSPDWFAKAGAALEKARKGMSLGDPAVLILENIAYGQACIGKAKDYARVAKTIIKPTIDARNAAIKANALDFTEEFNKIENEFLRLTRSIEQGNIAKAKNNANKVTQAFSDIELKAIKDEALGEVKDLLATALENKASEIAPVSFSKAEKLYSEADKLITDHRYNSAQIKNKVLTVLFQIKRLDQVMTQIRKIATMTFEETILWNEDILHQITELLRAPDMRDQEWSIQLKNIHASISSIQKDGLFLKEKIKADRASLELKIKEKQKEILEHKKRIAILEGESLEAQKARELLEAKEREAKAELEAEHRFQLRFIDVQNLFSKDQAEVYKQEHDLVIRLKAIRFPVGEAFITPDNYELLSILRSAIHTFGTPAVVIEGHTDSTGSATANEQLSQKRANAVRAYFVANEAIKPEKIIAIGYGSERPLVKNDTPEGRAVNRRIDVIIRTAE